MQSASTNITTFPGKVGISNANPTHTLAIGSNVYVDDTGSNKLTVTGVISGDGLGVSNIQTANVLGLTDNVTRIGTLETDLGDNSSRITTVSNDLSDNSSRITTVSNDLSDNSSRIDSLGDGAHTFTGVKTFQDDIILESNLRVNGNLTYANTVNMIVSDPIIELGANNQHTNDLGLVLTRHGNSGNDSNVSIFYDESEDNLKIGYTDDSASQTTLTTTATGLDVSITGNVAAAYDTDETSYFGRAAVGYMGQSDQASFSHLDKNTSANFALKQAASGATHLNTPTGQHIRFSVNAAEVGRFTGGGDFKVGANKLYVDTSASEVQMYSQDTGSTAGPDLVLMRNNPNNGSNNEYIGQIRYEGLSDTGNSLLYAKTTGKIKTATNGSEDGVIETMIKTGGSNRISVRHSGAKFLIQKGTDLQVGDVANLYVDTSTSRVGINVASPSYTLDVDGDINLSTGSTLKINGTDAVFSNWTVSSSNIYRSSGNVGIGESSPAQKLDVNGRIRANTMEIDDYIYHVGDTDTKFGFFDADRFAVYTGNSQQLLIDSAGVQGQAFVKAGDTNTMMRFPTADNIAFMTGGTDHVRIDSSGNVGIGTTSPDLELHVHDANATNSGIILSSTSGYHRLYDSSGQLYIQSGTAASADSRADINFTSMYASTSYMKILGSNGNVGIGTTSPSTKLHIYEATSVPVLTVEAAASGQSNYTRYRNPNSAADVYVGMDGNGLFGFAAGSLALGTGNSNIIFAPNYSTGEKMRINTSGYVGIGTTNPARPLTIESTSFDGIRVKRTTSGGGSAIELINGDGDEWTVGVGGTGTFGIYNGPTFGEQFTIDTSGNVGIGTTSLSSRFVSYGGALWDGSDHTSKVCATLQVSRGGGSGAQTQDGGTGAILEFRHSADYRYATMESVSEANYSTNIGLRFKTMDANTGPVERMRIDAHGKVGIGRTDPDYLLDVNGATRVGNALYVGKNTNNETEKSIFFGGTYLDNDYDHAVIERRVYSTGTEKQELLLFCGNDGATGAGPDRIRLKGADILFDVLNDSTDRTTENTKMIVKGDGNVGIGTTSFTDTRNTGGLHIRDNRGISFQADSSQSNSRHWRIRTDDFASWGSLQIGVSDNNSTPPDASDEAVMTMTKERRIGIGNTNPSGKLHVSGEINASAFTTRDTGSFGNNYDGVFMRPDGQVYISVDDNFYFRDNNSTSSNLRRHFFDTNGGHIRAEGTVSSNYGLDYAEYFEWSDGNPDNEDRIGCSVSLVENTNKIKKCEPGEIPLGVVSGTSSMSGGGAGIHWNGYWKNDQWGRPTYKQMEDDNGELVFNEDGTPKMKRAINPEYNETLDNEYLSRDKRKEWACVGLLGQVLVKRGVVTSKNWIKMKEVDTIKDLWFINATFTNNENIEIQLQAEKTKTATLETQVAALLARVTALENA